VFAEAILMEDEPRAWGRIANEAGLRALGESVNRSRPGPARGRRRQQRTRRRRSWWRIGAIVTATTVVLAGVVIVGGYAYLRYEFDRIHKYKCPSCVTTDLHSAAGTNAPFNVLLIGSDSRVGESAQSFGSSSVVSGARSDTIKIIHVDPASGRARLLSIPRDTFVTMSGLPTDSNLDGAQKINAAFNDGPNGLVETIENTFGIPISHFVAIDFQGLVSAVQAVNGIKLDFRYPVRDYGYNELTGSYNDLSGLNVGTAGCQDVSGTLALELARSRHFEYLSPTNGWTSDQSSDLGRIERQNLIIDALTEKAESIYNPLTLRSFISSTFKDIAVDNKMSLGLMYELAQKFHAFSTSDLATYTLPTSPAPSTSAGDAETVDEPQAEQLITQFLGSAPLAVKTPPLDSSSEPEEINATPSTTQLTEASSSPRVNSAPSQSAAPSPAVGQVAPAPYDPTPC
jgi:LCP family protein required for cell wall assembly